jgi:hypothetical protein
MQRIVNILKQWIPLAALAAAICGLIYLVPQQVLRQLANDPQIQLAQDAAAALARGEPASSLVPATTIEISQSLAPFVMIFDDAGQVLAGSARLHGQTPSLPPGLLDFVKAHGEDRVSWQPESGVRVAAVIVRAPSGYVLAGRSLREVEARESQVEMLSGLGLLATWAGLLVTVAVCEFVLPRGPQPA